MSKNKGNKTVAKKVEKKKGPTKKSVLIKHLKKGATLTEIAQAQSKAGLGDEERCRKTTLLWLHKREFKEQYPWTKEDDVYKLA